MCNCHRHLRHPRADILGFGAHWGAWPATARTPPPQLPARTLFQRGKGRTRPTGGSERRSGARRPPQPGSLSGLRSGRTAAQRKGRPDLPEGAARSSAGRRRQAAAPGGTAARRRGRRGARGTGHGPGPPEGPSAPPAPAAAILCAAAATHTIVDRDRTGLARACAQGLCLPAHGSPQGRGPTYAYRLTAGSHPLPTV